MAAQFTYLSILNQISGELQVLSYLPRLAERFVLKVEHPVMPHNIL